MKKLKQVGDTNDQRQQTKTLSPFMELYSLIIPHDNMLRQINELVDFSFVYDERKQNYCLDNGRNTIDPIRMFKVPLQSEIPSGDHAGSFPKSKKSRLYG